MREFAATQEVLLTFEALKWPRNTTTVTWEDEREAA
jgi:hypothetical protein